MLGSLKKISLQPVLGAESYNTEMAEATGAKGQRMKEPLSGEQGDRWKLRRKNSTVGVRKVSI